jgi:hypothetical protein
MNKESAHAHFLFYEKQETGKYEKQETGTLCFRFCKKEERSHGRRAISMIYATVPPQGRRSFT